jgi:hypothetical protein
MSIRKNIVFAILLNFTMLTMVYSANYYVSTSGNDSNSGTKSSPWRRCPGMVGWSGSRSLTAGDKVYFNSTQTWTASTGNPDYLYTQGGVTYIGDEWPNSNSRAKFDVVKQFTSACIIMMYDHPQIETVVKGFEVDGNMTNTFSMIRIFSRTDNASLVGATKRVENCYTHTVGDRSSNYGISVGPKNYQTTKNVEILNNVIHTTRNHGIALYSGYRTTNTHIYDAVIRGNIVYNSALTIHGAIISKNHCERVLIENNYVYNNPIGITVSRPNDIAAIPKDITIRNNIIRNNSVHGIHIGQGISRNIKVYGNLCFNNNVGVFVANALRGTVSLYINNNSFYNNSERSIYIGATNANFTALQIRNNIILNSIIDPNNHITLSSRNYTSNPYKNTSNLPNAFNSAGIPNRDGLSLRSGSNALNYGNNLGTAYNTSINKVTRPYSGPWDAGAYESGNADTTPPAAPTGLVIVD